MEWTVGRNDNVQSIAVKKLSALLVNLMKNGRQ
jgi:hypothetical protein